MQEKFPKEWWGFYKSISNKNRSRVAFEDFCNNIYEHNGVVLSDYIDSKSVISVKIYGYIFTRTPNRIKNELLKSINNIKSLMKNNNDKHLKIICESGSSFIIEVTDEYNEVVTKRASDYKSFCKQRKDFYHIVEINNHIYKSSYKGNNRDIFIDFGCGHNPKLTTPKDYKEGFRCNICSNTIVVKGINDIATTNPHLLYYFKNKEDAYKYTYGSNMCVPLVCPRCGSEKKYRLDRLSYNGFHCSNCSINKSYPNKVISELCKYMVEKQLIKSFEEEKIYKWCKYFNPYTNKESYGIYDVVIEEERVIIEMDGSFHNKVNFYSGMSIEESKFRDKSKDILAYKHGYKVIRIDCDYNNRKHRFNYIKENIIKSQLVKHFDINNVDWDMIESKLY